MVLSCSLWSGSCWAEEFVQVPVATWDRIRELAASQTETIAQLKRDAKETDASWQRRLDDEMALSEERRLKLASFETSLRASTQREESLRMWLVALGVLSGVLVALGGVGWLL